MLRPLWPALHGVCVCQDHACVEKADSLNQWTKVTHTHREDSHARFSETCPTDGLSLNRRLLGVPGVSRECSQDPPPPPRPMPRIQGHGTGTHTHKPLIKEYESRRGESTGGWSDRGGASGESRGRTCDASVPGWSLGGREWAGWCLCLNDYVALIMLSLWCICVWCVSVGGTCVSCTCPPLPTTPHARTSCVLTSREQLPWRGACSSRLLLTVDLFLSLPLSVGAVSVSSLGGTRRQLLPPSPVPSLKKNLICTYHHKSDTLQIIRYVLV